MNAGERKCRTAFRPWMGATLCSSAAILFLFACAAGLAEDEKPATKKILLIASKPDHPHGTHMYSFECELLAKCLRQTRGIEAQVSLGWPDDPSMLEGVAAIVFYSSPAGDVVLHPQRRATFEKLMQSGVGYAAIHWATSASRLEQTGDYIALLGGCFNFAFAAPPLAVTTERLVQPDKEHPICRGWTEYDLRDEWYLAMKFDERATPLAKVIVRPDTAQNRPNAIDLTVAWALERPGHNGGRSFGTTLGHFHDNFRKEPFRRMLVNAILWTASVDIPSGGSPVAVTDADLTLPPPPQP